jgi:hypothetical protein
MLCRCTSARGVTACSAARRSGLATCSPGTGWRSGRRRRGRGRRGAPPPTPSSYHAPTPPRRSKTSLVSIRTVPYVKRSAWWNLCHGCYKGGNTVSKQNLERFSFAKRFGTKFRKFASIFDAQTEFRAVSSVAKSSRTKFQNFSSTTIQR